MRCGRYILLASSLWVTHYERVRKFLLLCSLRREFRILFHESKFPSLLLLLRLRKPLSLRVPSDRGFQVCEFRGLRPRSLSLSRVLQFLLSTPIQDSHCRCRFSFWHSVLSAFRGLVCHFCRAGLMQSYGLAPSLFLVWCGVLLFEVPTLPSSDFT